MFGKGYMVNHCIAFFQKDARDKVYKTYIATGIQFIAENTAHAVGKGGRYLSKSYADIFKKQEERTGDEIANDVLNKCGLAGD
jgi:hypothetical protein